MAFPAAVCYTMASCGAGESIFRGTGNQRLCFTMAHTVEFYRSWMVFWYWHCNCKAPKDASTSRWKVIASKKERTVTGRGTTEVDAWAEAYRLVSAYEIKPR
jgi:hypothetical protein